MCEAQEGDECRPQRRAPGTSKSSRATHWRLASLGLHVPVGPQKQSANRSVGAQAVTLGSEVHHECQPEAEKDGRTAAPPVKHALFSDFSFGGFKWVLICGSICSGLNPAESRVVNKQDLPRSGEPWLRAGCPGWKFSLFVAFGA